MRCIFRIAAVLAAALPMLVFPACGVESAAYLESVEQGGGGVIEVQLTNKATIALPNDVAINPSQFNYWSILYRIYVSDTNPVGQVQASAEALRQINPSLASDYTSLYPYTDLTVNSIQNTTFHNIFRDRGYYEIALGGASTANVLNESAAGRNIIIEFAEGNTPTLAIADRSGNVIGMYTLLRSEGSKYNEDGIHTNINNPLPTNRYFLNSDDLNVSEYNGNSNSDAKANFWNLDVADNTSVTGKRYTYVSLYIIALGRDTSSTWARISSRPTFIAILKLPETS